MSGIKLAVIFSLLAATCQALVGVMAKLIGNEASLPTILFARFATCLAPLLPWALTHSKEAFSMRPLSAFLLRSVFSIAALAAFFFSLKTLSLANALLLNNTFPLFIPLVTRCLLGTRTPRKMWIGMGLGFCGIALILNPTLNLFNVAALVGLLSGICAAIAIVLVRVLTKSASVLSILFSNFFFGSLLIASLLPFYWQPLDSSLLLLLGGLGVCGGGYQLCSTLAFAHAPVRITTPLLFFCIVLGAIADGVIWHHPPSLWTLLGMAGVILGGILTVYFGQREILKS